MGRNDRHRQFIKTLRNYEVKMYDRSQKKVQESRRVAFSLHMSSSSCKESKGVKGSTANLDSVDEKKGVQSLSPSHNTFRKGLQQDLLTAFQQGNLGTWNTASEMLSGVRAIYANSA